MKWMHALLAAAVFAVAGCGQTEVKPPPGAEDSATSLDVDISGDEGTPADSTSSDSPPADPPKADLPASDSPTDLPSSKAPTEAEPPVDGT